MALLGLAALQPTEPRDVKLRFFGARGEIVQVEALPPLVEKYARVIHGLVAAYRQGQNRGLPPEAFPWTPRRELAAALCLQEQTVSQYICLLRKELIESFRSKLKRELSDQAVVQDRRGLGYRINPFFVRVEVHLPTDGPNWWAESNDERARNEARISAEQST